jgi:transcriptional regulator with XRE-family HTH domain
MTKREPDSESRPNVDPSPVELGRRIKLLRVSRRLTLKDLEETGKISATHVSEIERGKASPTLGALKRIANALGVRPAALVEPHSLPQTTLTRSSERVRRRVQSRGATLDPVAEPIHSADLGAQIVTLPMGPTPAIEHRHEGEEWATVLSGMAEIKVEDETFVLREGDAIHFRATRMHSYSNPTSSPAVLLVASRPRLAL